MAAAHPPQSPLQQSLLMDMPPPSSEDRMRALFERQWSRWHQCKKYEEAVRDPITRRLLALAVAHSETHALPAQGRRR